MTKMKIYVTYEDLIVSSYYSNEQWGEWREEHQFTLKNFSTKAQKNGTYDKFIVDFEPGDVVYAIYGIYSTGDSFGYSEGNGEILAVFDDIKKAKEFKMVAEAQSELSRGFWNMTPKEKAAKKYHLEQVLEKHKGSYNEDIYSGFAFDGKPYRVPWGGYFEILSSIEVQPLLRK